MIFLEISIRICRRMMNILFPTMGTIIERIGILTMKKIASVLTAAAVTAAMAVSVSATDYGHQPSYPLPPSSSLSSSAERPAGTPYTSMTREPSANQSRPGKGLDNPLNIVTKKYVTDAISKDQPIYASYENAEIKSNAMAVLARTRFGVLKVITKRYTVTINSESITELKDINLGMKITKNSKHGAMIINTQQQGEFGCEVSMTVAAKYYVQCGVDLTKAHIYYVDPDTNMVTDMGGVKINENAEIIINMTSGGKYIVM